MKPSLPTRRMREHPDLEQLKRQAKELLRGFTAGEPEAAAEVAAHYRAPDASTFALHHAQLVIARSYGFDSWPKLKAYVDGVTVRRLADAVRAGDLSQVRAVLHTRPELADMQMSYGDEHRPLHFAVMHRLPEIVKLLMRHGANARAGIHPHRDATSALTLAKERGYHEIVAIIEQEEQPEADTESTPEDVRGDEAARAAVAAGDLEWVRAQHAAGTLVNPVRWDDGGLLTVAVRNKRPQMLALLLDCGLDPNERVSEGEGDWVAYSQGYPLWNAAALGNLEIAELLLRRGADPNVHVDSSGSSVYSAFSHKQWEMVELLRRHGGVVTADTAAIYRQTELVRQMLEADPRKELAEEMLRFAASGGDVEIVRMTLARIDWPRDDPRWFRILTEPLYFWHFIPWLYAGNRELDRTTWLPCFRLILGRCQPNIPGSFGRTVLHEVGAMRNHITQEESTAFAAALLDAGARVDLRDDILKSTPLGWACRWGRTEVVRLLLSRGADPEELDAEPWARPRAWAEKMGHADILVVLNEPRP
uniref:Ankyrin n=1 Tax=Solibacter usitatus (strain Ellin6076) TaxID=234267 RepID=Q020D8_SOLUE